MTFDVVKYLEDLYGYMPEPRARKVQMLYKLAHNHRRGEIVELGTYLGLGTAAISLGLEMSGHYDVFTVHTVDPFNDCVGWAGEKYSKDNEAIFWARMKAFNYTPQLIRSTAVEAAKAWDKPVGLWFWDTGMLNQLPDDFEAWERHVLVGGVVYIRDTNERLFGSNQVIDKHTNYRVLVNDKNEVILEKTSER